jgi:hypothetical protein
MSELTRAWVWARYQGVILDEDDGNEAAPVNNDGPADDKVVQFRTIQNSRSEAMGQKATETRAKFGMAIAASILVGAFFPLIAFALFLVAVLLIASGKEPQKTEKLLAGLPGGGHSIKALAQVDRWLA